MVSRREEGKGIGWGGDALRGADDGDGDDGAIRLRLALELARGRSGGDGLGEELRACLTARQAWGRGAVGRRHRLCLRSGSRGGGLVEEESEATGSAW
jgi:hypothetical protein